MLDILIEGSLYPKHLQTCTWSQRHDKNYAHAYQAENVLSTLKKILKENPPKIEIVSPTPTSSTRYSTPYRSNRRSSDHPIHIIGDGTVQLPDNMHGPTSAFEPAQPPPVVPPVASSPVPQTLFDWCHNAPDYEFEDEEEDYKTYYCAINSIAHTPTKAFTGSCAICGDPHSFDNCKVLNDHALLKDHFRKFMLFLASWFATQERRFPGTTPTSRGNCPPPDRRPVDRRHVQAIKASLFTQPPPSPHAQLSSDDLALVTDKLRIGSPETSRSDGVTPVNLDFQTGHS